MPRVRGGPYVQGGPRWVTMVGTVTDGQVMGGVMKLGKALATGVAQEQPQAREDEAGLPADVEETEAAAPEEVPVPR
ncbi:hypothetical protein ACIF8T_04915 [Streptomyces sp. NPDC085946]|uniref:hypothetical protein n=1 Tax=Streptomyces sp. NPDC085946 TaxID=3365744 RepID=UPI0037D0B541